MYRYGSSGVVGNTVLVWQCVHGSSGVVGSTVLVSVAVCTDMGVAEW